jgi:hypothetical protein
MIKDIKDYLPGICYYYITSEPFRKTFKATGFSIKDFPSDENTELISLFENQKDEETMKQIFSSLANLQSNEVLSEIPFDQNELNLLIRDMLFNYRARDLGMRMQENPSLLFQVYPQLVKLKQIEDDYFLLSSCIDSELELFSNEIKEGKTVLNLNGFPLLSQMIGGFNPARVTMLLAQTGFGKTNFCLNLAAAAIKQMPVLFVNMEMSKSDIVRRLIVSLTDTSWNEVRSGSLPNVSTLTNYLCDTHDFYLTPGRDKSLDEIKNMARAISLKSKLGIIFVDYDQKLRLNPTRNSPEWLELQKAFIELEDLAKELECHVVIASQSGDEDGSVSGSKRSKYPCSNVLFFHEDKEIGPVIEPKKLRFGNYKKILTLNYEKEKSKITEKELIDAKPKQEQSKPTRASKAVFNEPKKEYFWQK